MRPLMFSMKVNMLPFCAGKHLTSISSHLRPATNFLRQSTFSTKASRF